LPIRALSRRFSATFYRRLQTSEKLFAGFATIEVSFDLLAGKVVQLTVKIV
jgi:hypothetical protein